MYPRVSPCIMKNMMYRGASPCINQMPKNKLAKGEKIDKEIFRSYFSIRPVKLFQVMESLDSRIDR